MFIDGVSKRVLKHIHKGIISNWYPGREGRRCTSCLTLPIEWLTLFLSHSASSFPLSSPRLFHYANYYPIQCLWYSLLLPPTSPLPPSLCPSPSGPINSISPSAAFEQSLPSFTQSLGGNHFLYEGACQICELWWNRWKKGVPLYRDPTRVCMIVERKKEGRRRHRRENTRMIMTELTMKCTIESSWVIGRREGSKWVWILLFLFFSSFISSSFSSLSIRFHERR